MTIAEVAARPMELTDDEVVRRVVAGERELFELLLRRYNQRIYRAVRAVLRNDADAEDVMQQAYVNAYRHLHQFEGRASFATWLTKIALREASARNRKSAHSPIEEEMTNFPEPGPDPETRAVAADLMHHVEAEVAALPEAYRSVLLLREVEGLSTEETAACLEVSADVVKTRLHRARTMLRDAVDRRAGAGLHSIFSFGASRCDRVVARVMEEISAR
ncbi:MAG TPA: RNA polymerase sigma factor [Thermoanaerobaculia bacterium]|nr:RNA polymerase sigma factor [Thermoanaerobaculia bacterium]